MRLVDSRKMRPSLSFKDVFFTFLPFGYLKKLTRDGHWWHCEATSEKMGIGHFCDGRASIVVGTHTHVPTADAQILPGGTAFQSDAGMCGDYNSVIGMEKEEPMRRFVTGMSKSRFTPANGEATLTGLFVVTDDRTGKATSVEMIRRGGRLEQSGP